MKTQLKIIKMYFARLHFVACEISTARYNDSTTINMVYNIHNCKLNVREMKRAKKKKNV